MINEQNEQQIIDTIRGTLVADNDGPDGATKMLGGKFGRISFQDYGYGPFMEFVVNPSTVADGLTTNQIVEFMTKVKPLVDKLIQSKSGDPVSAVNLISGRFYFTDEARKILRYKWLMGQERFYKYIHREISRSGYQRIVSATLAGRADDLMRNVVKDVYESKKQREARIKRINGPWKFRSIGDSWDECVARAETAWMGAGNKVRIKSGVWGERSRCEALGRLIRRDLTTWDVNGDGVHFFVNSFYWLTSGSYEHSGDLTEYSLGSSLKSMDDFPVHKRRLWQAWDTVQDYEIEDWASWIETLVDTVPMRDTSDGTYAVMLCEDAMTLARASCRDFLAHCVPKFIAAWSPMSEPVIERMQEEGWYNEIVSEIRDPEGMITAVIDADGIGAAIGSYDHKVYEVSATIDGEEVELMLWRSN